MKNFRLNHYERAFGNWLIDNHVQYIAVDEKKRAALGRSNIKSFDYLLYPPGSQIIVTEVKGRKFKGTSFAKLAGFECWVTADDVAGLTRWEEIFGPGHSAVFGQTQMGEPIPPEGIPPVPDEDDGDELYDERPKDTPW